MSRNIFVTSDHHFGHDNILHFKDTSGKLIRPFSSMEEMTEHMIDRWNSVVTPQDIVYHLGDFFFGKGRDMSLVACRLHGQKRLILGNHDKLHMCEYLKHFKKIGSWRQFSDRTPKLVLCHYPLHPSTFMGKLCVHGHVHQNSLADERYVNVCVEATNYTPVNLDDIG